MQLSTVVLSMLFVVSNTISASLLVAGLVASAVIAFGCHVMYLPYYRQQTNQLIGGALFVYCWACVCTLISVVRRSPEDRMEELALFMCLPTVFFTGYTLVDMRFRSFDGQKLLTSAFLVR